MSIDRILRMRDLPAITGIAVSTTFSLIAQGRFPNPYKLIPGGRTTGWRESVINEYLADPEAWVKKNQEEGGTQ